MERIRLTKLVAERKNLATVLQLMFCRVGCNPGVGSLFGCISPATPSESRTSDFLKNRSWDVSAEEPASTTRSVPIMCCEQDVG